MHNNIDRNVGGEGIIKSASNFFSGLFKKKTITSAAPERLLKSMP